MDRELKKSRQVDLRCGWSYREELREREEDAVNEAYSGGAYGCPGEYFRGAAALDCSGDFSVRCRKCWESPYMGEEWIESRRRDV